MTRSRNGSRNPSRGASPVRRGDDDRSPSPLPRTSRVRMQTPFAAAEKPAAKSDSPPHGRTINRSASRGASRGGSLHRVSRLLFMRSQTLLLLLLTISHLTQNIPTVSGHRVILVDTAIRPLISLRRVLLVPVPEAKVSNATMAVGMLAALGAASGSAAGRKVSNQVR